MKMKDLLQAAGDAGMDADVYVIACNLGLQPIRGMFVAQGESDALVLTDYDVDADPSVFDELGIPVKHRYH